MGVVGDGAVEVKIGGCGLMKVGLGWGSDGWCWMVVTAGRAGGATGGECGDGSDEVGGYGGTVQVSGWWWVRGYDDAIAEVRRRLVGDDGRGDRRLW
ncbi:hypothetical protein F0562_032810 [Nyssa sinensis]|uniref:Uncharacterized protein n=1 Tax=Nyssa sinensis TaxID=561372 RepID=A0A5J5ATP2_9ASTE|nr:hypothetical protein F0562_032810 [Nyssa sinensis]